MIRLALALLACLLTSAAGAGPRLDLTGQTLPPLAELVVRGTNHAAGPRALVVRVDDLPAPDYAQRVNAERMVPPGPFTLRLRLAMLRTPRGRALDPATLRLATAFSPDAEMDIAPLALDQPAALPAGTFGWFFGPAGAAPLAGFRAVGVDDPAVSGPHVLLVARPGQDPVLAWGMRLTRFAASLPPGRWHLTLWTEDPGEWETLPPVYERRLRLNGADLLLERRSDADWVRERYLAGRAIEADPALPPFAVLGARRGGRVEADVTLPDGQFVLELAGHPQAATHLAAITAAPMDRPDAASGAVEAVRAARFAEAWPVLGRPAPEAARGLAIDGDSDAATAPGGVAIFRLNVHAPDAATAHVALDGGGPAARLLWGMWRWRRPAPDVAGLVLSSAHLRADADEVPLRADLPRPLVVLVPVPQQAPAGPQALTVTLVSGLGALSRTLRLDVLPVHRPEPAARVGAFLDVAPHLAADPQAARRQAVCDLDTLRGVGLTAVAPALRLPAADMAPFLADLAAAAQRFPPPLLAYAPARALARALGDVAAAALLAGADAAARAAGLPPPAWTVADEPNSAGTADSALALAARIQAADPGVTLAAHVNDPADAALLAPFGLVTANPRFGADAADIARLRGAGHRPWLYNMPRLRLAAGFYLWRSGADGLLQWHARMPTADAFDPTDGREGDVQFLWPTPGVCAPSDLDADLLELADGAEDLRWLAWLQGQTSPAAQALLRQLRADIPAVWGAAALLPQTNPANWRESIVVMARSAGGAR